MSRQTPPNDDAPASPRRRLLLGGAAIAAASVQAAAVRAASLNGLPEPASRQDAGTAPPLPPPDGRPYQPVVTPNGWTLPWRMNQGVKEFHLVAEPVLREMAPGFSARLWGYNGQSPGPTIEVVEGDAVRIFVTNRLPERTSMHWHGQRVPNGMDGVSGLTQPAIAPGKTFVYEFSARDAGTFMYHPHADEMTQMAMGMMGLWITHPRGAHPHIEPVQRDYAILLSAYDIEPGASLPRTMTMLDFNLWAWNGRVFPGIAPLVARQGDRVRLRFGNLTMTNHPIHLHGHRFEVTGTDGGPVPRSARWPEVTTDIAVGQMRQLEFVADAPGDWALHCHKSHHTMNAMGHDVPNLIGTDPRGLAERIGDLVPDYMPMGHAGMADMGDMKMALPPNTAPMMAGQGPFGSLEMGGMFSVLKVRAGLAAQAQEVPGWYAAPAGTRAREWTGAPLPAAPQAPASAPAGDATEVQVRKPGGHEGHGGH